MMLARLAIFLLGSCFTAQAQQALPPSLTERAMSDVLIEQMSSRVQCGTEVVRLREQLDAAVRQAADLKRQLEEKKESR